MLEAPDPWVQVLNGKRGLHLVVLYLGLGEWRVPWSFRVWRGKDHPSPSALACKLLAIVPKALSQGVPVIVLADTEFGTVHFSMQCVSAGGELGGCAACANCQRVNRSTNGIATGSGVNK